MLLVVAFLLTACGENLSSTQPPEVEVSAEHWIKGDTSNVPVLYVDGKDMQVKLTAITQDKTTRSVSLPIGNGIKDNGSIVKGPFKLKGSPIEYIYAVRVLFDDDSYKVAVIGFDINNVTIVPDKEARKTLLGFVASNKILQVTDIGDIMFAKG